MLTRLNVKVQFVRENWSIISYLAVENLLNLPFWIWILPFAFSGRHGSKCQSLKVSNVSVKCVAFKFFNIKLNNYWMRLSMISKIIKAEVCVIYRRWRLTWITQTEALIILDIIRKPNSIIVLLYSIQKLERKQEKIWIAPGLGNHSVQ